MSLLCWSCPSPAPYSVCSPALGTTSHASGHRLRSFLTVFLFLCTSLSPAIAGIITGRAFVDYNGNGLIDATEYGVSGILVTAHDAQGQNVGSATTGFTGVYSFNASGTAPYRIEFSQIPSYLQPSQQGANGGSSVRFLSLSSASDFNLPLIDPLKFNTLANPPVAVSQFVFGTFDGSYGSRAAVTRVPYAATGHHFNGLDPTASFQASSIASVNQVGATYGVAHQTTHDLLYLSAYHKRFAGFGPQGPDAIYVLNANTNTLVGVIQLDALTSTNDSAGPDVHQFTPQNGHIYDLGSNNNTNNESFDGVGKRGLGDMELSADMKTLFVVNLFDRQIYAIDVSSGDPAAATLLQQWHSPDATGASRHRPFGLGLHEGKLWLGSVDENGSNAFVHSFIPSGPNPTFQLEVTLPLNYPRQAYIGQANNPARLATWRAWVSDAASVTPMTTNADEISWPQPMLSDIEFDGKNMILGLRDRFGDQTGYAKRFNLAATRNSFPISAGDLLLVCRTASGWAIEGSPGCSTSGGMTQSGPGDATYPEHYEWDLFSDQGTWDVMSTAGGLHWETTQGSLLQLAGKSTILTTAMNPFGDFSGGLVRFENSSGRREGINANSSPPPSVGGYTLYEGGDYGADFPADIGYFNEGNGLGAIEPLLPPAPIQIGNRVWRDFNSNGIQDASEPGIANVSLSLYDATGQLIATTTTIDSTDADLLGTYQFDQLAPDTAYFIVIDPAAFGSSSPLAGLRRSQTGAGTPFTDSDGVLLSGLTGPAAAFNGRVGFIFTTGPVGSSDHSIDFGFESCPAISISPLHLPNGQIGSPYTHPLSAQGNGATLPFLFHLAEGSLPPELTLATDGEINGTPMVAGSSSFTVSATDAEGCVGTQTLSLYICPILEIATTVPNAQRLSAYNHPIAVSGGTGPYTVSLFEGSLPAGLSLENGAIVGTPTGAPGPTTFTLSVFDSMGCNGIAEITLVTTCNALSLAPATLPPGNLYTPYPITTFTVEDAAGPIVWQLDGTLPAGLSFDPQTATLTGTPTETGEFELTLLATDSYGCQGSLALPLLVTAIPTWPAWQFQNPLNNQNGPLDNPDGDIYDNLQEFAFGFSPTNGINTTCPLQLHTDPATGQVSASMLRLSQAVGLTYILQRITNLSDSPAGWSDVTTIIPTVTYLQDGTEWATFDDVHTLPGLNDRGFFRIKIELDADQNGTPEASSYTAVSGFFRRTHSPYIESFSNPLLSCPRFTGQIDSVNGTTIDLTTSVGTGDLTSLFTTQAPHYLEITSGDQAGHRLEILPATCTTTTLAVDPSHPRSTLTSLSSALVGQSVIIRAHQTLDTLFHKPNWNATNSPATACRILVYQANTFRFYWLFRNGGSPIWVLDGDFNLSDAGSRVVDPSEGLLLHPRAGSGYVTLTQTGQVRSQPFAMPLLPGFNFKAGAWPMELSPIQSNMTTAQGFTGGNASANADRILFWNGDTTEAANGYDANFLLVVGSFNHWTTESNASLINKNDLPLFQPLRSAIIRSRNGLPTYRIPCPWTP